MQHRGAAFVLCLLLSLLLGVFAKDKPKVERTKFDSLPTNLFYFEDSDVVLVSDPETRTVWRSKDAGEEWKKLEDVGAGEVLEVLKHPYNNNVAVVIGMRKQHWITRDQGKTWKKWSCEQDPSVMRPAISFHATDPDRMLFFGATCHGFGNCDTNVWYIGSGAAAEASHVLSVGAKLASVHNRQ